VAGETDNLAIDFLFLQFRLFFIAHKGRGLQNIVNLILEDYKGNSWNGMDENYQVDPLCSSVFSVVKFFGSINTIFPKWLLFLKQMVAMLNKIHYIVCDFEWEHCLFF